MADVTVAWQQVGPGEVFLDSFDGADDDAKLQAAMTYAAAQSTIPTIRLGPRGYRFNKSIGQPYMGFRLVGTAPGMQMKVGGHGTGYPDVPTGTRVNLQIPARSGEPCGYWIEGTEKMYHLALGQMLIYSSWSQLATQVVRGFYGHGSGLWSSSFWDLTVQGTHSFLGNSSETCAMTLCHIFGSNNLICTYDTACNIGGSDNRGLFEGMTNIYLSDDFGAVGNGRYCMMFNSLVKSHIGSMYITATSSWRGLRCTSSADVDTQSGLIIDAPILEGDTAGAAPGPNDGVLLRVDGTAGVTFRDAVIDAGLRDPEANERGLVEVNDSARPLFDGCLFGQYGKPVTTPVIYADGQSQTIVRNTGRYVYPGGTLWGDAIPIVQKAGDATVTADQTVTVTG